ncbi:MAG: DUF952 domain-containing protein [Spirulina sp. SIO3F2]|nr:DUF952 domain-containing protein [Spirulina sp. SIO3F2]
MSSWICHITSQAAWQAAQEQGIYHHPSLADEGFIHCSYPEQVAATAQRFFQGQTGLVLLWIGCDRLTVRLQVDPVPGHGTFPHLYGPMNLDAVQRVDDLVTDAQGQFIVASPPLGLSNE